MKLSLRSRMILSFSAILSVLIAVFGGVILNYSIAAFRNQSYAYCRQIVESSIGLMDTCLGQMKDVSMIIANDADVTTGTARKRPITRPTCTISARSPTRSSRSTSSAISRPP